MPKKKTIIISTVSIVLLIALVIAGLYFFVPTSQLSVGFSTLGLQQAQYFKSSSACFDSTGDSTSSKLWLLTVRADGLSQWAEGEITPAQVASQTGKEKTKYPLKIDTNWKQECIYSIVKDDYAQPISKLSDPVNYACLYPKESDAVSKCGADWLYYGGYSTPFSCFCVYEIKKTGAMGNSPNFNNPATHNIMTVEVEANGEKYTKTLDSNGQIKGKIGNNVCAVWQGDLVTGQKCGLPSSTVRPAYINGVWQLISDEYYTTYKTKWQTFMTDVQGGTGWWFSQSDLKNKVAEVNAKADTALNSRIGFGTISEPTSMSNAKVIKTLDSLISYPVLSMYVRADWLGVVTPIPDPKITDITSECFASGANGQIVAKVKNVGDQRGAVDVYKSGGCSSFDVTRKSITLNSQEEATVYLPLTSTTSTTQLKETCDIKADAIENFDVKPIEVCVNGNPSCTVGKQWCENKNRWKCLDGITQSQIEDCVGQGKICQVASDGTTFCEIENYCTLHPEDPKCQDGNCQAHWYYLWLDGVWCYITGLFVKFRIIFAVVAGFLAGLFGTLFSNRFMEKKELKQKWWIFLIILLVLGGAVGYLAYLFFWVALVIVILLIALKIIF